MLKKKKKNAWAENGLEDWGAYMAAKKSKLEEQFQEATENEFTDATTLFRGIAIFVNGYTRPCADELKRLMMEHGGIYHHYMRSGATTHLIASNLPYTKIVQYRKSKNPLPLCKPEWITDSIKANKLLDWRPYLLYNSTSITQPALHLDNSSRSNQQSVKMEKNADTHVEKVSIAGPSSIDGNKSNNINDKTDNATLEAVDLYVATSEISNKNGSAATDIKEQKPHGAALCSKDKEFLTEFYNNSRLHHISTMGATFKEYVNELRAKNAGSFPGLDRLKKLKVLQPKKTIKQNAVNDSDSDEDIFDAPIRYNQLTVENNTKESIIMHIDMDCFFVSVGLRGKPELRGLPVAVTHARGNKSASHTNTTTNITNDEEFISMAEIASCSYEARKMGIKNGMFLGQALKLCPNLKTIKYDFEGYKEVSYNLYNTVASYTLDIEAVSCDEMYADVSSILQQCNLTPTEFAIIIRDEIKVKTGCPVSTGFGSNKLQARLATKRAKPDGQFYLKKEDVTVYIGAIKVQDIPGVGYSTMHHLRKMNVQICAELQAVPLNILQREFGKKTGEMLYNTCRGIDLSKLNIEHVRKSVSAEVNYGIRFENDSDARDFLTKLAREVCSRLVKVNAKGRCITLKLMVRAKDAPKDPAKFMGHGVCDNFTRSKNLLTPTDDEVVIIRESLSLWEQIKQPAHDIRGIGVQISRLEAMKKVHNTYMMKFITKGKQQPNTEDELSSMRETALQDVLEPKIIINNNNNNTNNISVDSVKNNNLLKNVDDKKQKSQQELDAFFSAKKPSTSSTKPSSYHFPSSLEIDKAVLDELPEDIKMEIINYHKNDDNTEIDHEKMSNSGVCPRPRESINNDNKQRNNGLDGIHCKTQDKTRQDNNVNSWHGEIIPASQGIDEDVLTELPEDIKNEILASKPIIKKSLAPKNYFKETKPGIFSKAQLPNVQELDMQVLIELPDDIRNEILNEYKSSNGSNGEHVDENINSAINHKNEIKNKDGNKNNSNDRQRKNTSNNINVSFSQIDPDFLAALSDDIKDDVKMYCIAKKKENEVKINKVFCDDFTKSLNLLSKKPTVQNNVIPIKKRGRPPKNNNTKSHLQKPKHLQKNKIKEVCINKNNNNINDNNDNDVILSKQRSFLESEINNLQGNINSSSISINERDELIKQHQLNFQGWKINAEYQEMLTNIVNYLFSLPLYQVKNHIQTWIFNSTDVNDIDTLSIATFLGMLPKEKRIEDLYILMKTIYRCMTKSGSCVWHETYRKIVEHVQHYMQIEYNSNLMLPSSIRCNNNTCECNKIKNHEMINT